MYYNFQLGSAVVPSHGKEESRVTCEAASGTLHVNIKVARML